MVTPATPYNRMNSFVEPAIVLGAAVGLGVLIGISWNMDTAEARAYDLALLYVFMAAYGLTGGVLLILQRLRRRLGVWFLCGARLIYGAFRATPSLIARGLLPPDFGSFS